MKIILTTDVPKLGKKYDIKDVASGHALNLLIPNGLAVAATPHAVKKVNIEKLRMEGEKKVHEALLAENIKALETTTITIAGKVNEKGHLFAGIHQTDIARELAAQARIQVDPSFIMLEHPIKEVGEHKVNVSSGGKSATFTLVIKKN